LESFRDDNCGISRSEVKVAITNNYPMLQDANAKVTVVDDRLDPLALHDIEGFNGDPGWYHSIQSALDAQEAEDLPHHADDTCGLCSRYLLYVITDTNQVRLPYCFQHNPKM